MKSVSIKAVIFDLDDTLIPSSRFYPLAVASVLDGSPEKISVFQDARQQVKATLPYCHTSARNRLLYFKRYLELMGEDSVFALELCDLYEDRLGQMIREWSDENRRFQSLEQFRLWHPLYVLTNENSRSQLAKIAALCQSRPVFSGILTSEEAGFEKPDPRIFQLLLKRFHLQPDHCLYVGDSVENDMIPAEALGMSCIHTLEFSEKRENLSNRIPGAITHLDQLLDFL